MIEIHSPKFLKAFLSIRPQDGNFALSSISKNDVLQGSVLKSLSQDTILLLINGNRIKAKTSLPLSEGQNLSLKVDEVRPKTVLKLIGEGTKSPAPLNTSRILSSIKENIWESIMEDIGRRNMPGEKTLLLQELIDNLSRRMFLKSPKTSLRKLIHRSGLGWESKLGKALLQKRISTADLERLIKTDLKGLASRMIELKGEDVSKLKRLVSTIQDLQVLNKFGLENSGRIFLPVPVQFPDGLFTTGQLLIHLNKDKKQGGERGSREAYRMTFFLEMSRLGPMRADLAVKDKEIEGRFLVTHKRAGALIQENLPGFIRILKDRGFRVPYMECHVKRPEIVKEPLITEIIKEHGDSINFVA